MQVFVTLSAAFVILKQRVLSLSGGPSLNDSPPLNDSPLG